MDKNAERNQRIVPSTRDTDSGDSEPFRHPRRRRGQSRLTLVVVWCRHEPDRVGEVLRITTRRSDHPLTFGRDDGLDAGGRIQLHALRPGSDEERGAPGSTKLSRSQLEISVSGLVIPMPDSDVGIDAGPGTEDSARSLYVRNVGRCRLLHNGLEVLEADVQHGDLLELKHQLLLLCLERPELPGWPDDVGYPAFPFGEADPFGIVGESPAAWAHRLNIATAARLDQHVLVLGETGVGKESTVRALHALSARGQAPLVSCDFTALPEHFVSTLLYGNAKGILNGAPASAGLVAQAEGGVLFLDEIGDVPSHALRDLRRFLETGEYRPVGAERSRIANVRVVGATNRDPADFPGDVRYRFRRRLYVPLLKDRVEDIPLIARHHLWKLAKGDPRIASRFFEGGRLLGAPRLAPALVARLLKCAWEEGNVRAVEGLLDWTVAENLKWPDADCLFTPDAEDSSPWTLPMRRGTAGGARVLNATPVGLTGESGSPAREPVSPAREPVSRAPGVNEGDASRAVPGGETRGAGRRRQAAASRRQAGEPELPDEEAAGRRFSASLGDSDAWRLSVFRRHAFRVDDFCVEARLGSSVAHDHLNILLFKALVSSEGRTDTAARLVAGEASGEAPSLQRRLEAALDRMRRDLVSQEDAKLKRRLQRRYRSAAGWVERVIVLMREGRV